ncbi:MAG: hypothetical protein IT270_14755 [Saprospiraceae bacterium]|nr:hypothetical protein [Saprospiraceae bacterium]
MNDRIEIPLSKAKLLLSLGGSLMFVVLGIGLITTIAYEQTRWPPIMVQIVGVASILFFGMTGYFGVKKLFSSEPALIIDHQGITDRSSAAGVGLILWQDIIGIRSEQVITTKFLLIDTIDPEKYIGKSTNAAVTKLMRANMAMYGTPITINALAVNYNFKALEKLVVERFENSRPNS